MNNQEVLLEMYTKYRNDIVDRLVRKFDSDIYNTCHMTLGIFTEIAEMDEGFADPNGIDLVNIKEEHGDLIFYVIGYSILRNIELEFQKVTRTYTLRNVLRTAGRLADLSKKKLAYDKEYDRLKEQDYLQTLFNQLLNFYDMGYYFDPVESMDRVYRKLSARYENGFSVEAANNRNLKKERAALEKECHCESGQEAFCICFSGR